jgi:alkanesulfonate monooxygenase SsuD/methylene tetrahydromethanopterin reductase-like flavin-dependent oxidoreductase (luciferase family)
LPRPLGLELWVAGSSDAGLQRAIRFGDGWLTVYVTPAEYAESMRRLRGFAAQAGRDPSQFGTGIETYVTVASTHEDAIAIARASLIDKFGSLERGLAVTLVGSPQEVMEKIYCYQEAGARDVELKFVCHDTAQLREMMHMLAEAARLRR